MSFSYFILKVFQNRFDGESFHMDFEAYENGFGDLDGDFWLGMQKKTWKKVVIYL